jgi:GNAT superfamily N-acetyltransferase
VAFLLAAEHIRRRRARRCDRETGSKENWIMSTEIQIGRAGPADRQELRDMQAHSFRTLAGAYYEDEVIEAFIAMGTMDDSLLEDGTYYAARMQGRIVGCGGWSWRTPAYAARLAGPAPASVRNATVRSLYVHPDFARRGIASRLMAAIEMEIADSGYETAALTATLSGIPLYRRLAWRSGKPVVLDLPDGHTFVGLNMTKRLVSGSSGLRTAA